MVSREMAARMVNSLLNSEVKEVVEKKIGWHIGKVDLRYLLDYIYESPPLRSIKEEHIT